MNKVFLILFFLSCFTSTPAQDKKALRLYNKEQYCDCIERVNDLALKDKTPNVLYMAASSYYQLSIAPDKECMIKDPLTKCLNTLVKIRKAKPGDSVNGFSVLCSNAVSSGIQSYRENMARSKWDAAIAMIEHLKKIENNSTLWIDQAVCEFGIAKSSALETACNALNLCKIEPDKKGEAYTLDQASNILLNLESTTNKDFHPFMDTLFNKFPDNEQFANSYYTHWKNEIRKHNTAKDYDFMFKTVKVIFSHYPNKQAWKKEMSGIVLSIADSMTQRFLDKEENFQSYIACCNFLMKARMSVGDILPDLKNAKYYRVKSTGNKFVIERFSSSISFTIKIEFSFRRYGNINNAISFDAVVPGVEMQKIKGFLWADAPKLKRAKKANDLVNTVTFNSMLLDTLSHVYCNKFRAENKKKPLIWSMGIYRASKHHSLCMASLGCIIHGEDNDSLYGNPDSINYYLSYFSARHSSSGENCLSSYTPKIITYDSLAKKIISLWIGSPGHRANMLQDIFKSESISTSLSNYSGHLATFLDDKMAAKYYPELNQLFLVFPDIKKTILKPDVYYYSSQNFRGEYLK